VARGAEITVNDINIDETERPVEGPLTLTSFREIYEKRFIRQRIEANHWNISRVARELDLSRTTLYDLLNKYGIPKSRK